MEGIRIRLATVEDRPAVVAMARQQFESSVYATLMGEVRDDLLAAHFDLGLERGVIYVAEVNEDELVGFLGVIAHPHPLSGEGFMRELAWFVVPAYRRGRLGQQLLTEVENWGRSQGLSMIEMSAPVGRLGDKVGRFYVIQGYAPVETAYFKRL